MTFSERKTPSKSRQSQMTTVHTVKLIYHSLLFFGAAIFYVLNRIKGNTNVFKGSLGGQILLFVMWLVFSVEMVFRLFPSKLETTGSQKHFKCNYKPINVGQAPKGQAVWRVVLTAAVWVLLNAFFVILYFLKIIDQDILILLSLAYSVGDMVCVLFFCPYQVLFLKNRCCTTCRIYNWDYFMMCTPLIFVPHFFTWGLLALSVIILLKWEITALKFPERFCENTNDCLSCKNCQDKLCVNRSRFKKIINKRKPN